MINYHTREEAYNYARNMMIKLGVKNPSEEAVRNFGDTLFDTEQAELQRQRKSARRLDNLPLYWNAA